MIITPCKIAGPLRKRLRLASAIGVQDPPVVVPSVENKVTVEEDKPATSEIVDCTTPVNVCVPEQRLELVPTTFPVVTENDVWWVTQPRGFDHLCTLLTVVKKGWLWATC